ncbi:MAG: 2OG-Fe(II) oxygenase [Sphingomonas sp.]|uniref:2OG-Fe(II) oxygenase n=1 Tax=Sphingomonas sp. TaxID=28214 RepID=UPI0017BB5F29|nr:2OG-Fe(II) oxygenase [Sphingomonas sp.]MBA3666198.1 2OG-Fe(II) oxygenase [Sphingomonas sp.]
MTSNAIERAESLFRVGQYQDGLDLLGVAARANDPDALAYLASMSLSGDVVNRDLKLSRDLFRRAGLAGSVAGAAAYRAFVANGTGGPPDWTGAVKLLEQAAATDTAARRELDLIARMRLMESGDPIHPCPALTVSKSPEVQAFESLFTDAECNFLIESSMPAFEPSTVVDPISGALVPNPVRTSDATAYPWVAESPAIHALCRRLAVASGTKVNQGEPMQVLRYRPGQEYRAHFDALTDTDNQRILTFLVYLNDDYEDGETEFLATGLRVKGRKGDALLFRNVDRHGQPDPNSEHAGLPVARGEKFLASRWIRERPFGPARD